jgi:hypothetical protein
VIIVLTPPSSIAPSPLVFTCPICTFNFPTRRILLEHLRSSSNNDHKSFRFGAYESPYYPLLVAQGVLAYPRGCGAFFNGGDTGSSKLLEASIARGSCCDRRTQAPLLEVDGPFLVTTMAGVRATWPFRSGGRSQAIPSFGTPTRIRG